MNPLSMSPEEVDNSLASITSEEFITDNSQEELESGDNPLTTIEEETSDDAENSEKQEEETTSDEQEEATESVKEEEDTEEEVDAESIDMDYKAEIEKLFQPFKANGKAMAVNSVDEAIKLMQMGANYAKKMTGLKPSLKILKTLEKNGLLDEDKLNLLIEVSNNNPQAIAKVLKDAKLDPLDLDISEESTYVPKTYTTTDSEIELEEVLSNIRETPSYSETIDIVSNKWDTASKQVLINNPSMLEIINEHVGNGSYAQISEAIDKERILGNLRGMNDLEAYRYVGTKLHEQALKANASKTVTKPTRKEVDPALVNRKKAASLNGGTSKQKTVDQSFNPLSLSAEELDKIDINKYL